MLTNQNDLIKQLNKLKTITPDQGVAARGRALIFVAETPRRISPLFLWASAFALTLLIFSISLIRNFENSKANIAASLNPDQISQEFNNLSINIELKDITYRQDVNQTIASALTEIGTNQAQHLNPDVIQSEAQGLNLDSGTNPQIDELLKTIIL